MDIKEQEILNKHEERSKNGFSSLHKFVIDQKVCNYCGCCVSVCPSGCLSTGDESPQLIGECDKCGVCYMACPRTFLPMTSIQKWLFKTEEIPPLGSYTKAVLASSNNKEILDRAPDGGIVTTIFTYLLDNNLVDAVITTGKQHDCVWCYHPKPMVITDSDELLDAIDRKYDPNPLLTVLKETSNFKKVAFVGLACHVLALKKLQYAAYAYQEALPSLSKTARKLTKNIDVVIGLGCMCRFGKGKWDVILKEYGVDSEEMVTKHYEERISGDYVFHLEDGGEARVPHRRIIEYPHHMCFLCRDYDGYFSDITIDRSEYQEYSTVLIRNEKGEDIFNQCLERDLMNTRDIPDEGRDFLDAMIPMLESLSEHDTYGYEHFLKEGEFRLEPTTRDMMGHFEARRFRGIPENILLELLKKYPIFEFAKKKRKELGYENPDIF